MRHEHSRPAPRRIVTDPMSPEQVREWCRRQGGNISALAREIGIARTMLQRYRKGHPLPPAVAARMRDICETSTERRSAMTGQEMRAIRDALGWTQPELAERLGFADPPGSGRKYVSRLECGNGGISGRVAAHLRTLAEMRDAE